MVELNELDAVLSKVWLDHLQKRHEMLCYLWQTRCQDYIWELTNLGYQQSLDGCMIEFGVLGYGGQLAFLSWCLENDLNVDDDPPEDWEWE